jgi:hypothetical protein
VQSGIENGRVTLPGGNPNSQPLNAPFVKNPIHLTCTRAVMWSAALLLLQGGCSKSKSDSDYKVAETPKEAATQLERAFQNTVPEVQQSVTTASQALRTGDYEKAVVTLQVIRSREGLTLNQGLAIHSSMVALEGKLIYAMEAGDQNARRAFELLKQLKRE